MDKNMNVVDILDGSLEYQEQAIRSLFGLKPGQTLDDLDIPNED